MTLIAAVYSSGKVVTGIHHGEAFSKLEAKEKEGDILSGFLDPDTGHFTGDDCEFYVKELIMIRHAACMDDTADPPLNAKGYEQIIKMVDALIQMNLDGYMAFTSPARRCTDTAFWINYWLHRNGITPLEFSINEDIQDQDHTSEHIHKTLDTLPNKALLVTHSDIINEMAHIAVGQETVTHTCLPNASLTIVKNQKIVCFGKRPYDSK